MADYRANSDEDYDAGFLIQLIEADYGSQKERAQRDFKLQFEVSRFDMIRQGDKQAALDFWAKWQPASALRQAIQACNEREGQDL